MKKSFLVNTLLPALFISGAVIAYSAYAVNRKLDKNIDDAMSGDWFKDVWN